MESNNAKNKNNKSNFVTLFQLIIFCISGKFINFDKNLSDQLSTLEKKGNTIVLKIVFNLSHVLTIIVKTIERIINPTPTYRKISIDLLPGNLPIFSITQLLIPGSKKPERIRIPIIKIKRQITNKMSFFIEETMISIGLFYSCF